MAILKTPFLLLLGLIFVTPCSAGFGYQYTGAIGGDGILDLPEMIARDAAGHLYVEDSPFVKILSPSGELLGSWKVTRGGRPDNSNGSVNSLDVLSDGTVVVAEGWENVVCRYAQNGTLLNRWDGSGTIDGPFTSLREITVGQNDRIYVLDNVDSSRVSTVRIFNATGAQIGKFTTTDTWVPLSIEASKTDDTFYILKHTMYTNIEVEKYSSTGQLKGGWSWYNEGVYYDSTNRMAVGPNGSVYMTILGRTVSVFDPSGQFVQLWGSPGTGDGQFSDEDWYEGPGDLVVLENGDVFATDTGNHRLQRFQKVQMPFTAIGEQGSGNVQFSNPWGIAVDRNGSIFVSDNRNQRIQKLSSTGAYLSAWPCGTEDGLQTALYGLDSDAAGNVYVSRGDDSVRKYSNTGQPLLRFGASGSGNGNLNQSRDVAVSPTGEIIVADTNNNRIQRFTSAGGFLGAFGSNGTATGQFQTPTGVAVDTAGNIFVADWGNHRIQKFTPTGTFIAAWGSRGSGNSQFINPMGVAVDADGNIYVADWGNDRVEKLSPSGSFLVRWGCHGTGEGFFNGPTDIAVAADGTIAVVDYYNQRIQLISQGSGPTVRVVPGGSGAPLSTAHDGLYDDVNGNGRKDFADVVLFFNQLSWIPANEPVTAFDYNGNNRIDFADVVWLFNHL
ncbi:MAG: dockerin type I domain-containing protein [Methanospirillum sp.]